MYKPRQEKITELLNRFATAKEIHQKDLTIDSARNTIRQLQLLESQKLISVRIKRREKGQKGAAQNIWSITDKGIAQVLANISISDVEAIVKVHSDLSLIFEKWDQIKKAGASDLVWQQLKLSLSLGASNFDDALVFSLIQALQFWTNENDSNEKFIILCKTDPKIKSYLDKVLSAQEKSAEQRLKNIRLVRTHIGADV